MATIIIAAETCLLFFVLIKWYKARISALAIIWYMMSEKNIEPTNYELQKATAYVTERTIRNILSPFQKQH